MTARELDFIVSWVDGGAPKGTMEPPPHLDHSSHWMLGNPDQIVTAAKPVAVERGAPIGFRRLVLDPGLTQDRWVRAIDYKPESRRSTRLAIVRIADTGLLLGTWTPLRAGIELPAGTAVKVPAGARISVDVLYQPAPEDIADTPRIGLYFAEPGRLRSVRSISFEPPILETERPNQVRVKTQAVMVTDTTLIELLPEMPAGARSLELKVKRPDGSLDVLLWARHLRRDWPAAFVFAQPLLLPSGSLLQAIAYFDGDAASAAAGFALTLTASDAAAATAASASRRPATAR